MIQGADDVCGSARHVTEIAGKAAGPVETRVLAGCGHQPHLEQRAATIAAAVNFRAEVG